MRIAVFHNLPSGGAKRTLLEQVKRLTAHHQIDVFTLSCAEHDFCDLRPYAGKCLIAPFSPLPLFRSPLGRINQLIRLIELIRLRRVERTIAAWIDGGGYDVVYVQPCQYTNSPAILRYLSTSSVFYCQEPLRQVYDPPARQRDQERMGVRRALDRIDPLPVLYKAVLAREDRESFSAATRVLANSEFSKERFVQCYDVTPEVCYHGVDAGRFRPLGFPRQELVLSVGALRANKGFDFLIRSLGLVPPSCRPALVIVSNYRDPGEWSYLERLARETGVSLELQVLVSDDELVELYNRAALTLYAPILEPFGLVPLESMACGTPVVGVAEGGIRETVVNGVTGILVERDEAQFAQAVSELLEDERRRTEYGQQGREYVLEHWTWEASVARLERHLAEVAGEGRQTS